MVWEGLSELAPGSGRAGRSRRTLHLGTRPSGQSPKPAAAPRRRCRCRSPRSCTRRRGCCRYRRAGCCSCWRPLARCSGAPSPQDLRPSVRQSPPPLQHQSRACKGARQGGAFAPEHTCGVRALRGATGRLCVCVSCRLGREPHAGHPERALRAARGGKTRRFAAPEPPHLRLSPSLVSTKSRKPTVQLLQGSSGWRSGCGAAAAAAPACSPNAKDQTETESSDREDPVDGASRDRLLRAAMLLNPRLCCGLLPRNTPWLRLRS
jgi:hypothetical protein